MSQVQEFGLVNLNVKVYAIYKECQRNHAASIGQHAVDGCREFLAAGAEGSHKQLTCAACGCHRNFHRKLEIQPINQLVEERSELIGRSTRKMTRRRYTQQETKRLKEFAENLGWKTVKEKIKDMDNFCNELGITRKKFQVWMSDHKP